MHDRDVRARAIHLERRLGGGVAAADDHHALTIVRVRLAVVMMDVRQILAGDAEHDRPIEVADRDHDMPRVTSPLPVARRDAFNRKDTFLHWRRGPTPGAN